MKNKVEEKESPAKNESPLKVSPQKCKEEPPKPREWIDDDGEDDYDDEDDEGEPQQEKRTYRGGEEEEESEHYKKLYGDLKKELPYKE